MLYEKNKFAEMCGMPQKSLQTYILRHKVILDSNGLININVEANSEFLKKWSEKNALKIAENELKQLEQKEKKAEVKQKIVKVKENPVKINVEKPIKVKKEVIKIVQKKEKVQDIPKKIPEIVVQKQEIEKKTVIEEKIIIEPTPTTEITIENLERLGITDLEKLKKKMDILKIKEDTEIQQLKKEKMQGEVLPVELSKSLFLQHNKQIIISVYNAFNDFLTRVSIKYDISSVDQAKYKGDIKNYINKAASDSLKETEKGIKNITQEIANKRGQGERT